MIETLYPELIVAIVKKETYVLEKNIESWHEKWNEANMTNYHYKSENYDWINICKKKCHSKTNKTESPVLNWESIWAHFL